MKLRLGIITATDTGLIGDDHDGHVERPGSPAKLENAVYKGEILDAVDIVPVNIDHAVAIEEQRRTKRCGRR